jgi:hypothetical protein
MLQQVLTENPDVADSDFNGQRIGEFLKQHTARLCVENFLTAVTHLSLRGQLELKPPPAPPVVEMPAEPVEVLEPSQLSIHASEYELRQPSVTSAQLKDYLRRVREAGAAKKQQ